MLKVENVKKSYGENVILDGIDLDIKDGEVYGLIGANGAGKTTLFNIISQVLDYDEGSVYVDEKKINTINDLSHKLGYIIDIPALFDYMTAFEYLEFIYSSSNKTKEEIKKRSEEVLSEVGLLEAGNKRIKAFSRGMRQKMGIAAGLIFEPQIILMDEPSSALDPIGRREVLQIIQRLKSKGKTIILSTHILNDIERVCDRVGLLVNGKIVIEGNLADVMGKYSEDKICVSCSKEDKLKLCKIMQDKKLSKDFEPKASALEIAYKSKKNKQEILKAVIESSVEFTDISLKHKSLEEIFILESKNKNEKRENEK